MGAEREVVSRRVSLQTCLSINKHCHSDPIRKTSTWTVDAMQTADAVPTSAPLTYPYTTLWAWAQYL